MKAIKTWEMIKELSENPKKKFKRKTDGLEIRNMCGRFNWEPGYTFLGVNDEWEEVKEPVDFMEVVKKSNDNTTWFKVEHSLLTEQSIEKTFTLATFLDYISETFISGCVADILSTGKFYIED